MAREALTERHPDTMKYLEDLGNHTVFIGKSYKQ